MNTFIIEVAIGCCAIMYAIISIFFRIKLPLKFKKLEPMKKIYGVKLGITLHILFYTVIPFLFGIILIRAGLLKTTLF